MAETYLIQGMATVMQEQAALVIFNNETADPRRLLTVRNIEVRPTSPQPSATVPGSVNLRRISAIASGTGDDITPNPHAAGSALPAQVAIKTNCIVTPTAHQPYRRLLTMPVLGISTGNSYLGNASSVVGPVAGGPDIYFGPGTIDQLTLAEGEGLAMVESAQEPQFTFGMQIVFTVGGNTYSAFFYGNASNGGEASWAIFNGSGSGVTLKINAIIAADQGTSGITQLGIDTPYIRYSRVHGYSGGEALTAVPMNLDNTPPAALVAMRNRLFAPLQVTYESGGVSLSDQVYPNGTASQIKTVRQWGTFAHRLPFMGSIGGPNVPMADLNLIMPAPFFGPSMGIAMDGGEHSGIVLRPQEGLAMLCGTVSGFSNYYFRARVVHTPPAVAAGNTYSRSRVVNA